jgi:serine/threonine-protein kinase RsbW
MTRTLHLTIDSRPDCVELVSSAVRGLCRLARLTTADLAGIELALVEAVNNAIEHAYHGEPGHPVMVVVDLTRDRLSLRISDRGAPMDPRQLDQAGKFAQPDLADLDTWSHRGRGLNLIKACMETVEYRADRGLNTLTMSRTLPGGG